MPSLKTASTSGWPFSQWNSTSSRSDTWHPLVSISCAPTLESTSSVISVLRSRLGVTGTLARRLLKSLMFGTSTSSKLQEEFLVNVLSFPRRVPLQSGSLTLVQSRETIECPRWKLRKIMLLSCRLKEYKMRTKLNFWLNSSTNGDLTRLCHKWNDFCLFWLWLWCGWLRLAGEFHYKRRWRLFIVAATRLSFKAMCTITIKQKNSQFLVLKKLFKTWQQASQFLKSQKLNDLLVEM